MGLELSCKCKACGIVSPVTDDDIEGLDERISDERSDAVDDARDNWNYQDDVSVDSIIGGARPLHELAVAVRKQDRAEAEYWLDKLGEIIGARAKEDIDQGRFSPRAREGT